MLPASQDAAQRRGKCLAEAPLEPTGTYHHIVDVVCFLQSHILILFAFSMFVFCKHNIQKISESLTTARPTAGPRAEQRPHRSHEEQG